MDLTGNNLVRPYILNIFNKVVQNLFVLKYTLKLSPGTKKGQNIVGIIVQADVVGFDDKGNEVQQSFIIKTTADHGAHRALVFLEDAFFREIYIYSKLLPEFEIIQKEKKVLNLFKSYPTYYASSHEYGQEAIILDNMKCKGYKHWNRKEPADLDHVSLVVRELGRFHALSYAMRDQKPRVFDEIIKNTQERFFQGFSKVPLHNACKHRIDSIMQILDPVQDKDIYEKYKQFADNGLEIVYSCIDSRYVDQYAVVNHGDCSISNFLFKYEDLDTPHVPTQLCFFDWQMARIGSPVLDLSCFLFSCTDKEFRTKHYHEMISEYYNSLSSTLEKLGSDVNKMLPHHILEEQFNNYAIFGLFFAAMLIFVQLSDDEEIPDFSDISNENADHGFIYSFSNISKFNSRVRDVVYDFHKLGYNFVVKAGK